MIKANEKILLILLVGLLFPSLAMAEDTTVPSISFVSPTPNNATTQSANSIYSQ